MRIDRIEVFRVHVPMKNSTGLATDSMASFTSGLDKHILKVYTDDRLVGLGETWKGTPDSAVRAAATTLLGKDPTRLSLLRLDLPYDPEIINVRDVGEVEAVPVRSIEHNPSIHAFEIALADVVGQAFGVPICQLLGGAVRDRVLVHYWSGRRTPTELGEVARGALAAAHRRTPLEVRLLRPAPGGGEAGHTG